MDPMILSVLYVWCMLNQDQIVSFWFGTQFRAMYLPWVLLAFRMILSGGGLSEIVGILVGHLYFFLAFKYPQDFGGASLLQTPQFLYNYFPGRAPGTGLFSRPPQERSGSWGRGNRLGGN
ncbi:hypothetical protein QYM36_001486 [Artemia franciscana]|uniref:Derlin n=4 Tax=Artemia franciscana TaxID=6661 RepID=A0AA88IJT5_ARTSF|nr:hypothetical protein QYM36_001486 [Artemia franciscana]